MRAEWRGWTVVAVFTLASVVWVIVGQGSGRLIAAFLVGAGATTLTFGWMLGFDAHSLRWAWGAYGERWTAESLETRTGMARRSRYSRRSRQLGSHRGLVRQASSPSTRNT